MLFLSIKLCCSAANNLSKCANVGGADKSDKLPQDDGSLVAQPGDQGLENSAHTHAYRQKENNKGSFHVGLLYAMPREEPITYYYSYLKPYLSKDDTNKAQLVCPPWGAPCAAARKGKRRD